MTTTWGDRGAVDVGEGPVVRIVVHGPSGAGKTTTARSLGERLGRPVETPAEDAAGRTTLFDWLEYEGGRYDGRPIRAQVVTVPGHDPDRRARILADADAVLFVADTTSAGIGASREVLDEVRAQLSARTPRPSLVVQANKRDAPEARPMADVHADLGLDDEVVIETVATDGTGVRQAFVYSVRAALALLGAVERSTTDARSLEAVLTGPPEPDGPVEAVHTEPDETVEPVEAVHAEPDETVVEVGPVAEVEPATPGPVADGPVAPVAPVVAAAPVVASAAETAEIAPDVPPPADVPDARPDQPAPTAPTFVRPVPGVRWRDEPPLGSTDDRAAGLPTAAEIIAEWTGGAPATPGPAAPAPAPGPVDGEPVAVEPVAARGRHERDVDVSGERRSWLARLLGRG